jgi:hypothetical protein
MAGEPDFLELIRRATAVQQARTRRRRKLRRRRGASPNGIWLTLIIDNEGNVVVTGDPYFVSAKDGTNG